MFHLVARALPGRLLFHTHAEAAALFAIVCAGFEDAAAICLMPDHVHIVARGAADGRFGAAMSAFTRARNHRRAEAGPLWTPHPPPVPVPDEKHLRRTVRYVHLNPCRAGLVSDPLAWPWSTHRDAVGRAVPGVRPRERDPERFHRWVSGDPSVSPLGTPLTAGVHGGASWEDIVAAVSSVCRVPPEALWDRGHPRTLAARTAWAHGLRDARELSRRFGTSRSSTYRLAATVPPRALISRDPPLQACFEAVGDPRFDVLHPGDLRRDPRWCAYRGRR